MKGLFIAFEGIDGSGLTTHSKMLVEWLGGRGLNAVYTKEPTTNSPVAGIIRQYLFQEYPKDDILALLFAADRLWHLREDPLLPGGGILGALRAGYVVVCDRYKYSSIAYQGSALGVEWVYQVNARAVNADVIVYIDVPVETALKRLAMRDRRAVYEERDRMTSIKHLFNDVLKMAEEEGVEIVRIPGVRNGLERSIEEVQIEIRNTISKLLGV